MYFTLFLWNIIYVFLTLCTASWRVESSRSLGYEIRFLKREREREREMMLNMEDEEIEWNIDRYYVAWKPITV